MIVRQKNKANVLSAQVREQIDDWLLRYPSEQKRSGVLQALHIVQREQGGWLSTASLDAVADYLNMERSAVYEIATFYSLYHLEPVGKHVISVCRNISCMLRGADRIFEHLEKRLNIKCHETTPDHQFTLGEAECLGACIHAPACQINAHYYENLSPEKMDQILDELIEKEASPLLKNKSNFVEKQAKKRKQNLKSVKKTVNQQKQKTANQRGQSHDE